MKVGPIRLPRIGDGTQYPRINFQHPLARNLTAFAMPGSLGYYNLATKGTITPTGGSITNRATIFGMAKRILNSVPANNGNIVIGNTGSLFSATAMTAMIIRTFLQGTMAAFGHDNSSTNLIVHAWLPYSDNTIYFDFGGSTGANRITWATGGLGTVVHSFVFTAGSAGSAFFVDGVKRASQGTAISATVGNYTFGALYDQKNTDTASGVDVILVACWNRQLSDTEIYLMNAAPCQILSYPRKSVLARVPTFIANQNQKHFRFRIDTDAVDAEPTWGAAEDVGQ